MFCKRFCPSICLVAEAISISSRGVGKLNVHCCRQRALLEFSLMTKTELLGTYCIKHSQLPDTEAFSN